MAEKNNHHIEKPSKNQDSSHQDPPSSAITASPTQKTMKEEEEDQETTTRQSKRRKNCPKALDKVEEFTPSNPNFSFTFDTQFTGSSQEFTPKFGSFNLVVPSIQQERTDDNSLCFHQSLQAGGQEGEDQQVGVSEEREIVSVSTLMMRSFDEVKEIE